MVSVTDMFTVYVSSQTLEIPDVEFLLVIVEFQTGVSRIFGNYFISEVFL